MILFGGARGAYALNTYSTGGNYDGIDLSIPCEALPDTLSTGISTGISNSLIYNVNFVSNTTTFGEQNAKSFCLANPSYFPDGQIKRGISNMLLQPAGTYYYLVGNRNNGVDWANADYYYMRFTWNGSEVVNYNSTTTPLIYTFTYSTTTEYANITGYWQALETAFIDQRLSFWQYSIQFGKEDYIQVVATTTGEFNFSFPFRGSSYSTLDATTTEPILTSFTLNAALDRYDSNYYDPFGQLGLDQTKYIVNLDATSTTVSGIDYGRNDYSTSTRGLAIYPEYECGITSLTGCFKNAIIWAFYPTQDTVDNYYSLLALIQTKPPAGYFFMVKDNISGLTATTTKAFNIVIPSSLKTYIFSPVDISVAAILWLFYIFNFYKRLKHITI